MSGDDHTPISSAPRLFVDATLAPGAAVALGPEQTHYLLRVMRRGPGAEVLLFNGRDGLWRARVAGDDRRRATLQLAERLRPQPAADGPWLAFGVPKRPALEWILQKGTELGATKFLPVASARAMAERLNPDRLARIVIEAAEQCERLDLPTIEPVQRLGDLLAAWPPDRTLLWCDEQGGGVPIADALDGLYGPDETAPPRPWGLMIGPEGGFASGELDGLGEVSFVSRVALGPRVLRAETAAIAALAIGQALAGDGDRPVRAT
ncbi:MAG: 16S rRNA (uracil(1498)-N(3))-methyltransferase [Alphaproteobacteria bacterium]|nr:16S rRNA (uracil(1498)-N(3))-methyltransferase [Alphaproteobacteria bacterium]MCB9931120.1 16S rRNA (uracil(1498)-N(3))-methyltransferase [Alphaproteobacteria bacterium]